MVNLETAKAMFECLRSNEGSAQLVWMSQAAWPALICQLYDYTFEQTAAYFGARVACEPVHILWDSFTGCVKVANSTLDPLGAVEAEAWIHAPDGAVLWQQRVHVDVAANDVQKCFALNLPAGTGNMFFVKLRLRREGRVLSENFYWNPSTDCTWLNRLAPVALSVSGVRSIRAGDESTVIATVSNPSSAIALVVRLKLVHAASGDRVLPAMYEDNYFSLLPGEQKHVQIRSSESALEGHMASLHLEGWNIRESSHPVQT